MTRFTLPPFKKALLGSLAAFFLLTSVKLFASPAKNEGLFAHKEKSEDLIVLSLYVPYAPAVLILGASPEIYQECKKTWPLGHIMTSEKESLSYGKMIDLLWINGNESLNFSKITPLLSNVQVFYITSPSEGYLDYEQQLLGNFLSQKSLLLCTKWNCEQGEAASFFLKRELYDGFVESINFNPVREHLPIGLFLTSSVHKFLKPVGKKGICTPPPLIDFIYLINLDKRPEKLALTLAELQNYGIIPHRFSAVNGWILPISVLDELGVKLAQPGVREKVMGKVFREEKGKEYRNIEFIENPQATYFCTGITRGAIGCLLSHLSVLKDAYETGYETIWVLEDDIKVHEKPSALSSLIQELDELDPSWDILYTDVDHKDTFGSYIPCRALAMRPDITIYPLSHYLQKFKQISPNLSQIGMRYGTHSMILRRSGIKKILDYYENHALFLPYDCDFWLISSLKLYAPTRDLVSVTLSPITDNGAPNYSAK